MDDPARVQEEIRKLKDDVHALRERLAKMNEDLAQAAWCRRVTGNRRAHQNGAQQRNNFGRRASDCDPIGTGADRRRRG